MQITINHAEIVQAITEYVGNQGINISGKDTQVEMVAGRGANGHSATVTILQKAEDASALVPRKNIESEAPAKVEFSEEDENEATSGENAVDSPFA